MKLKKLLSLVVAGAMLAINTVPAMATVTLENGLDIAGSVLSIGAHVGEPLTIDTSAWFSTDDAIVYSLGDTEDEDSSDVSSDVSINATTGELTYTPDAAQLGKAVTIEVTATDADNAKTVTLLVNVVAAGGGTGTGTSGPLTDDADIGYVDTSAVFEVTLPTTNTLGFAIDPQGLVGLADGKSASLESLTGGAIISKGAGAFIKNESSVAVEVGVELYVTATGTGADAVVLVDDPDNVEKDLKLNMLLLAIPGKAKVAAIENYAASTTGIPVMSLADTAGTATFKFVLDAAKYEVKNTQGVYSYGKVVDATNYDSASFQMGGNVNSTADWKAYGKAVTPETIKLTAVFSYKENTATKDTTVGMDAHGLATGATKVTVTPVVSGTPATLTVSGTPTVASGVVLKFTPAKDKDGNKVAVTLASQAGLIIQGTVAGAAGTVDAGAWASATFSGRVTISAADANGVITITMNSTTFASSGVKAAVGTTDGKGSYIFSVTDTTGKTYSTALTVVN